MASSVPLIIEVRCRTLRPGEPVRIEVRSPQPLASLRGEFLGRDVSFDRRASTAGDARVWAGWAMIALDEQTGPAAVEVSGSTTGGLTALGTHAVTIEAKEFPVEELSVASRYVDPPAEAQERLTRERSKLRAVYESRRTWTGGGGPFLRPVDGDPTSVFGTRRVFNGQPRSAHPGLDLRAGTGTPVLASGSGTVAIAQDLYYAGRTVILDHGGGLFTIYAHLAEVRVREGDRARRGQVVGLSGATGRVTGPHLHWGAKIGDLPFDPRALLDPVLFGE